MMVVHNAQCVTGGGQNGLILPCLSRSVKGRTSRSVPAIYHGTRNHEIAEGRMLAPKDPHHDGRRHVHFDGSRQRQQRQDESHKDLEEISQCP